MAEDQKLDDDLTVEEKLLKTIVQTLQQQSESIKLIETGIERIREILKDLDEKISK